MKTRLLSCCIAALSFAACEDPPTPRPRAQVAVKPTARSPNLAALSVVDAGPALGAVEPIDLLALKPAQGGVDHLARAKQLASDGDRSGALTEARRALYGSPLDEEALQLTARQAQKLGKHDLSAEAWGRLAQLRTDDAAPLVQQARALIKARQYDAAVTVGTRAIARDSGNPESYQATGLAHLGNSELPGAIAMFSKVVELNPEHGFGLNNLGLALLRANENEHAVEVLSRAATLLPNTAYVHNNLGIALERVGRRDEAQQAYLCATNLSPKYVKARVNASRVAKAAEAVDPEEDATMTDVPHLKSDAATEN